MVRPRDHLAEPLDRVELGGLRRRLERDPDPVRGADVRHLADGGGRPRDVACPHVGGAHDGRGAESLRPAAGLGHGREEARPLRAVGEHPAQLAADAGHDQAARADQVEHRLGGLARLGRPREVDPPELDGRPPRVPRGPKRVGQRRRVERPGVEREALLASARGPGTRGSPLAHRPLRCANASGLTTWSRSPFRWAAMVAIAMFSMLRLASWVL